MKFDSFLDILSKLAEKMKQVLDTQKITYCMFI